MAAPANINKRLENRTSGPALIVDVKYDAFVVIRRSLPADVDFCNCRSTGRHSCAIDNEKWLLFVWIDPNDISATSYPLVSRYQQRCLGLWHDNS